MSLKINIHLWNYPHNLCQKHIDPLQKFSPFFYYICVCVCLCVWHIYKSHFSHTECDRVPGTLLQGSRGQLHRILTLNVQSLSHLARHWASCLALSPLNIPFSRPRWPQTHWFFSFPSGFSSQPPLLVLSCLLIAKYQLGDGPRPRGSVFTCEGRPTAPLP